MKIVKVDTEFATIKKWFQEIESFISSPSLSHVEAKFKDSEFIELDIFYDNHEHVLRIKFMDNAYQDAIKQIINPKPIFHREFRPDELSSLKNLAQEISQGKFISVS
ncbi:MAG: hypothetical protein COW65_05870 [Cytophagales bacterium CG18_big_fil_WC_8_21_14_2_50_42_9]|nr:MAG: hypothetical protein COW65_05870 [Cytophagales bacterium CG18_big_fil_WC_8_21_14_2_50_42_9]